MSRSGTEGRPRLFFWRWLQGAGADDQAGANSNEFVNDHICDLCDHVWTTDKDTGAIVKQIALSRQTLRQSR